MNVFGSESDAHAISILPDIIYSMLKAAIWFSEAKSY